MFDRYVGIDYSGARTPTSSLKGLRVFLGDPQSLPIEVHPPPSPRKYWTRRGIAEWLVERPSEGKRTLVGIDHGYSFPLQYSEKNGLEHDWPGFLDDFQHHWPTDEDHAYVDFVRNGILGNGAARSVNSRWRRLTEVRSGSAKSVFHFAIRGCHLPSERGLISKAGSSASCNSGDGTDIKEDFDLSCYAPPVHLKIYVEEK
jgi:hypothetical protein